jgi:hypothetical protein
MSTLQNGIKFLVGMMLISSTGLMAKELHNTYSLALVGMSMDYKEYNPDLKDSEASSFTDIAGFEMSYGYKLSDESKINASIMYVSGYSDYIGSELVSGKPVTSRTVNDVVDFALDYTCYRDINYGFTLDYGVGIGYRYWQRQLSSTQTEIYDWFSIRPKIGVEKEIGEAFTIKTAIEYQYGIKPNMYASNLGADFTLGSADILKGNLRFIYSYSTKMDIFIDASLEKQTIGKSNIIASGGKNYFEPDSTAYNQYLKFGVTFKY